MKFFSLIAIILGWSVLAYTPVSAQETDTKSYLESLHRPDSRMVTETLALALEGVQPKNGPVTFARKNIEGFPNQHIQNGSFVLHEIKVFKRTPLKEGYFIKGTIEHVDRQDRRILSYYVARYRVNGEKLTIQEAYSWPQVSLNPTIYYFFVPTQHKIEAFLESKPSDATLFDFLRSNAIEINDDLSPHTKKASYYIVALSMSYLGDNSQMTIRLDTKHAGLDGTPMRPRTFKRNGFPLSVTGAAFQFGLGNELFFKTIVQLNSPDKTESFKPYVAAAASTYGRYWRP